MLTLHMEHPHYCPICGEPSQDHLPMFPCGHDLGHIEKNVTEEEWRELFGAFNKTPLPYEFMRSTATACIIDKWESVHYFAPNPLVKALDVYAQEKMLEEDCTSYKVGRYKMDWLNMQIVGTVTFYASWGLKCLSTVTLKVGE